MVVLTSKEKSNMSVADFYAGKSVFITGGTGFLGKVFIEKLLYSCPDIDKIYMLIREKKGQSIRERMTKIVADPLFNRLKDKRPGDLDKIVLVPGDITVPGLGISEENETILTDKVSVVIHSAATVKFNEPLATAWNINVEGTKMIMALSRRMKRIEVFIHISTAYTNTNRAVIDEVLYPPPADINEVHQHVKNGVTEEETEKILNGRPNTYTFTKALTEHLVAENQAYMPTIIVRPSIVGAIKDDPIRGWLSNWYGATGLTVFTAKGLNRVIHGHPNHIVDLIPVDYVANLVIVAGAKTYHSNEVSIYNCCSSSCNPITMKRLVGLFIDDAVKHKSYVMPLPGWYVYSNYRWLVFLITLIFQVIPAFLGDIGRRLLGKSPRYYKLQNLVAQTQEAVHFFTSHTWEIKSKRTRELFSSLSLIDQRMFPCDANRIGWTDYITDYSSGVRKFLEKKK
ncbi:putative fatty acyl-CoA reductase CG5065 [Spodoptera frugiperda]|uniref:Fatty acyl-CoA reductase n=1 Tax=Spodoptera frugiperda TaxID=7108 RepID=A0A9R0F417_SPOFR|nr:putative fatty acyl-CoA reductase CG5065 [Spodoptera frugiperda]